MPSWRRPHETADIVWGYFGAIDNVHSFLALLPQWHFLPSSTASAVTISQSSSALVNILLQGGGSPEGASAYETSIF